MIFTGSPPLLHIVSRPSSSSQALDSERGGRFAVTAEEWALAASVFLTGLAAGLLGMLSTIMRPMLAAMDGRDLRSFMEAFLRYADHGWGKVFNYAWSAGMGIGPIITLVLLRGDPGSSSFVLTAIGLGGGTAALLHDQLDPVRDDLGGVGPIPGGTDLPLIGPQRRLRGRR